MTFDNFAKSVPDYWSSYWSAADNVESSLIPEEGLPDQTWNYSAIPVYCAHPHAWILYCYFRINEN
jgi:cellobiose phosphorylase